jgi:ATP-binding cassette subfamily B protein
VRPTGNLVLDGIDLDIAPGEHLAVIGASGAGKSTLVGLLLGLVNATEGRVLVDGAPLVGAQLDRVRRRTAWIDPAVQLWNRTLADNVCYGAIEDRPEQLGAVLAAADLQVLLESLPDGTQTPLGTGGALLSGGEGQRVRLARALLRPDAQLVILDEPFRGLDRAQRIALLARVRRQWHAATLICITHDVSETSSFPRVLVMEHGRIVEDAPPTALASRAGSRYLDLLAAERAVGETLGGAPWRRLRLRGGRIDRVNPQENPYDRT